MRLSLLLCAVALLGCGCGSSSAPTVDPLPMPPATDPASERISEGLYRFHSTSAPLEDGRPYRYRLYTHCWETMRIDLDGSHWAVDRVIDHDGRAPLAHGDPFDEGIVTVDADDASRATYRSDLGDMTLVLRRLDGPVVVPICA